MEALFENDPLSALRVEKEDPSDQHSSLKRHLHLTLSPIVTLVFSTNVRSNCQLTA
jgi:hypothetical protein